MNKPEVNIIGNYIAAGDENAKKGSSFYTDPSLTRLSDGSFLLVTLEDPVRKLGPEGRFKAFRSIDHCKTWSEMTAPTIHDEKNPRYGYRLCFITEIEPGNLLASYVRVDRTNRDEPQFHIETDGMQYSEVRLVRSYDNGETWNEPATLDYQLPDLIMAGGFVRLPDDHLGMPCEIWHEWDKGWREGPSTRLIRSFDNGETWPEASVMARDEHTASIFGDPKIAVLPDGKLMALFWRYSLASGKDMPIHSSLSADSGRSWGAPKSSGIVGQRSSPVSLGDGLVLCVYQKRFGEDAGLKGIMSFDEGKTWTPDSDQSIYRIGHHTNDTNPFSGYTHSYAFGYSSVLKASDHEILIPFWMNGGAACHVRILRIGIG